MTFDSFELKLLNDAWQQMSEASVQNRLSAFTELRETRLNNEGWFEWELYYRLLKVNGRWNKEKRSKGNRKPENCRYGDGVDLQFNNGKFIEVRAITTEIGNMPWVLKGLSDHPHADACLFLALYHENLKKWLASHRISKEKIKYKDKLYEILLRNVNNAWIVGIIKELKL